MERLNQDVRFEIFNFVAEFVDDSVFILMCVCTEWQAQVLRSPWLWRYITISDDTEDLDAKMTMQLFMSQELPLVVRVYVSLLSSAYLNRILHRPIAALVISSKGTELLPEDIFTTLTNVLSAHPPHQIRQVMCIWGGATDDIYFTPASVQEQIYDRALLEDVESVVQTYPVVLLTRFSMTACVSRFITMGDGPSKISLTAFMSCVRWLTHLVLLTMDYNLVSETTDKLHEVLWLPRLQELEITFSEDLTSFTSIFATPNLQRLTLHGAWEQLCGYLSISKYRLQLKVLSLHIIGDRWQQPSEEEYKDLYNRRHIALTLEIDMEMTTVRVNGLSEAFGIFHRVLVSSLTIDRVYAYIPSEYTILLHGLQLDHPPHTIHLSSRSWDNVKELPTLPAYCDTLAVIGVTGKPPLRQLPCPRGLVVATRHFSFSDLPTSWAPTLSEIEADRAPDHNPKIPHKPIKVQTSSPGQLGINLVSLRCLKCQIHLAIEVVTSDHRFPALEELYIVRKFYHHKKEVVQLLTLLPGAVGKVSDVPLSPRLPKLHTLGIDWFPEWEYICTLRSVGPKRMTLPLF
ncbi:SubName: Full=Uncharacterized protein {ECO:0000313/EMBL:CCA75041.1} [Serendipita indica DSM 11827]|nr:SubName: Full=Uncharacterized protein {ECO:0000313/EMBL:CCA75041.1} [Serendipita indica DSM 11827]